MTSVQPETQARGSWCRNVNALGEPTIGREPTYAAAMMKGDPQLSFLIHGRAVGHAGDHVGRELSRQHGGLQGQIQHEHSLAVAVDLVDRCLVQAHSVAVWQQTPHHNFTDLLSGDHDQQAWTIVPIAGKALRPRKYPASGIGPDIVEAAQSKTTLGLHIIPAEDNS